MDSDAIRKHGFQFHLDNVDKTLYLTGEAANEQRLITSLHMNGRLADLLGFKQKTLKRTLGELVKLTAVYPPDLRRSIYSIYVYCNIIESIMVGSKRVPLLRAVHFNSGLYGETISQHYPIPLYFSVNTQNISYVEVELRDDMGELIPFAEGKTSILLHFRRRRL